MKTYDNLIEELVEVMTSGGVGVAGMHVSHHPGDNPENISGREPDRLAIKPRKKKKLRETFAGCPVFTVASDDYAKCMHGRTKYERWNNKMDMQEMDNQDIRTYAHRNPGKPIIIKDSTYGTMSYLIPRQNVNEGKMAEIDARRKEGETPEQIAKGMKVDVSVIKKILQGRTPAVVKGRIQGSRLNKDKFGTGHVYKADTVQGKPVKTRPLTNPMQQGESVELDEYSGEYDPEYEHSMQAHAAVEKAERKAGRKLTSAERRHHENKAYHDIGYRDGHGMKIEKEAGKTLTYAEMQREKRRRVKPKK